MKKFLNSSLELESPFNEKDLFRNNFAGLKEDFKSKETKETFTDQEVMDSDVLGGVIKRLVLGLTLEQKIKFKIVPE